MSTHDWPRFGKAAPPLVANSYEPVPLYFGQKNPSVSDWVRYLLREGDTERYAEHGVGILCGTVIGLDNDVREPTLAQQIDDLTVRMFGECPCRIGLAPKKLRVVRTNTPFAKLRTLGYVMPGDDPSAPKYKPHRVEILVKGAHFVAYNKHPDTGQPYVWNGSGDPLTVPVDQLPLITEAQAQEYIAECGTLLAAFPGARLHGKSAEQDAGRPHVPNEKYRAANPAECREALAAFPNDNLGYHDWGTIMLATKAALAVRRDAPNVSRRSKAR
jgi:hypothetical protein